MALARSRAARVARRMWEAVGDDYVHDVTNVVANIDPHWCEKHPDEGRLLPEGECRFTSRSDQPVSLGWHAIEHAAPQEDHGEEDEAAGGIDTGQIVMFGLTGGLIPCPASITVLLICLQLKHFALGATLVFSFSIGLALTLVASGAIAALSLKHATKRWPGFSELSRKAPWISAALITVVGIYMSLHGLSGILA